MSLSTSVGGSGLSQDFGGYGGHSPRHPEVAFTHTMTAALPSYKGQPIVVSSTSPFHSVRWERAEDGGHGPSYATDPHTALNTTELDEDFEGVNHSRGHHYLSTGPAVNALQSPSMPLALPHRVYSPLRLTEPKRPTGARQLQSESGEEEKGNIVYRDFGLASKSPITPSSQSHGQTLVRPWQNPFPLPVNEDKRAREGAIRFGDTLGTIDQVRGGGNVRNSIQRDVSGRDRDMGKEGGRDYINDTNSQSSMPSVQSLLTADTLTVIDLASDERGILPYSHEGGPPVASSWTGEVGSTPWKKGRGDNGQAPHSSRVKQSYEH